MSGQNNSTLTAVSKSATVNVPPNRNDFVIGEIDWVNNASTSTDQNFKVDYTFTLSFTSPTGFSDSQLFHLEITQPTNPAGDKVLAISNATLSNLGPFPLNGISVSDIHFSLAAGDPGTYNGTDWFNPEGISYWYCDPQASISKLFITADFTAAPEPASLTLLGIGMIGTGVMARRRRSSTLPQAAC